MSFFKSLFYGKPQPDNAMTVYLEEIKQMSEALNNLRTQFGQWGRCVQVLGNTSLQLAHTIRQFNQGMKLTNPHVQDYAVANIHFRDDVNKVWSKQYVDEVLGMFDHWNRQAEAQQTTISNYHIARDHCYTLKIELQELQDRKQGYLNQKKSIPVDLTAELTKADEQYSKYSIALENIRSAIVANQNKLLGKNGQLLSFSRSFYALLEAQVNLTSYFGALTDSYTPLLDSYRQELGINTQAQNQLANNNNNNQNQFNNNNNNFNNNNPAAFQFKDDITVLDIAHFIRETASLEGDRTTLTNVDQILTMFDPNSNEPPELTNQLSTNNNNMNNNNNNISIPSTPGGTTPTQTTTSLTIQTGGGDSPHLLSRRDSLQPPASPSNSSAVDPNSSLPVLSFALSTRKKRTTMVPNGPLSPNTTNEFLIASSPISTSTISATNKKSSSRASTMMNQPSSNPMFQSNIPPFQLDDTTITTDNDNNQFDDENTTTNNTKDKQQVMCAFAASLDDDDDDNNDFLTDSNTINQQNQFAHSNQQQQQQPTTSFQSILERMVNEETDLVAQQNEQQQQQQQQHQEDQTQQQQQPTQQSNQLLPPNFTQQDLSLLAQHWSVSDLNPSIKMRETMTILLSTLNALCTKYIADWIVVEIELQLWAKSPTLHLLLCTLNTLTICKQIQQHQGLPGQPQLTTEVYTPHPLSDVPIQTSQPIQYGFTFRSASPETSNQYFYYVYNIFTALTHQLLGPTDDDIMANVNKFVDIFSTPQGHNEYNVQRLVQAAQILRLLAVLCDKCLLDIQIQSNRIKNNNAITNNNNNNNSNQNDDEEEDAVDDDDEDFDEDDDLVDDEDEEDE